MKDIIKVLGNERVDLEDFRFISQDTPRDAVNEIIGNFVCNPSTYSRAILEGFEITNVSSQITITKGRAILHQRFNGTVIQSVLTTSGDDSITIDIATYPNNTYGIYIRFIHIPGEPEGRVFWNPTGTGSEYSQTMETRYLANWTVRIESSTPGEEWFKIGEVLKPGYSITDERNLYFEGPVDYSYRSCWGSTSTGGTANDRDSDRSEYGITDLHTFVCAMRQCVEDIKGRGLRRWWESDIGGMNIGFTDDPEENTLAIEDEYFNLKALTSSRTLNFKDGTFFQYNIDDAIFRFAKNGSLILLLDENSLYPDTPIALGGSLAHWSEFYVDKSYQYDEAFKSCCENDSSPSTSTHISDEKRVIGTSRIFTTGTSGAYISRRENVFASVSPDLVNTFKRRGLIEGYQAITNVDHTSTPASNLVNSMYVTPGAAYVGGSTIITDSSSSPIQISDLWNGSANGGLTTEAKTYLTGTSSETTNCLWFYVWMRVDGTFWVEPFGPEPTNEGPWQTSGDRFGPRSESGLPQSGFSTWDYTLVDVLWLVHGKAGTGTSIEVVNFSAALYNGSGYRAIERANYNASSIRPMIFTTTDLTAGYTTIPLNYVDGTNLHYRSPGVPSVLTRKARIAITGSVSAADGEDVYIAVGFNDSETPDLPQILDTGARPIGSFTYFEENNTGSAQVYLFSDVVDVPVNYYLDSSDALYKSQIRMHSIKLAGSPTIALTMYLMGFYWDRNDNGVNSNSIETV